MTTTTIADVQDETECIAGLRAQLNRARAQRKQLAALDLEGEGRAQLLGEMDAQIAALEVELGLAEPAEPDPLEALRRQRGSVALRILEGGDKSARQELAELDARIGEAEQAAELEALAAVERERLEREAAQEALRAERARLEADLEAKLARRAAALLEFREAIVAAAALVPDFCSLDVEVSDLGAHLGRRVPSLRGDAIELAAVLLRDAGLTAPDVDLTYVPAASRARLLQRFAELAPTTSGGGDEDADAVGRSDDDPAAGRKTSPDSGGVSRTDVVAAAATCSVCAHDDRAAIEADLAAGITLREIEERHGVSRSALSRHRRHNGKDESEAAA